MKTYDFVAEDIKSLIRKLKKQHYASGKYLENSIKITKRVSK